MTCPFFCPVNIYTLQPDSTSAYIPGYACSAHLNLVKGREFGPGTWYLGPTEATGAMGSTGAKGATGAMGSTGAAGAKGASVATEPTGPNVANTCGPFRFDATQLLNNLKHKLHT